MKMTKRGKSRVKVGSGLFGTIALGALAATQATATSYYVSTSGSDSNSGTAATPLRTITHAYAKAAPGDLIIVKPGRYTDYSGSGWGIHLSKVGSADNPITLRSEARGEAIIDGLQSSARVRGFFIDGAYNILDGFRITNAYGEGIGIYGGRNNTIKNCEIDHNGLANPTESGHSGVYTSETSSGNSYIGNRSHENGNPSTSVKGHGFYAAGVSNETYANNIIYGNYGFGIQVASYRSISNFKILNNTISGNGKSGVVLWSPSASFSGGEIKNNIIAKNAESGVLLLSATGSGVIFDGNLSYGNGSANTITSSGASLGYSSNRWVTANPAFVGSSDFHLQAGSPAIDKGVAISGVSTDIDGNARQQGAAPDIGAYETGGAASAPRGNLLTNPSFASGLTGWAHNWGNNSLVMTSTYDGSPTLRTGTGEGGLAQQLSSLKPGNSYTLKFAGKSASTSDTGGYVGVGFYDAGNVRIAYKNANVTATEWTNYSLQVNAPAAFAYALVYAYKNIGSSYLLVDDFTLE